MQLVYTSGIFSGSRYVSVGVVEHVRFRCLHELYQSFAFFLSEFALLCFVLLHHPPGVKDGVCRYFVPLSHFSATQHNIQKIQK